MILREKINLIFYILSVFEILGTSTSGDGAKHKRRRLYYNNHDPNHSRNSIGWHDWYKHYRKKDLNFMNEATSRQNEDDNYRIAIYDWVCLDIYDGFMCAFCDMSILCVKGHAYQLPCPENTKCSYRASFNGAICHTEIPLECQCSGRNEILKDPYNPYAYHVCHSSNNLPYKMEMCPIGYVFNEETSTCKSIPVFPSCITHGTFPLTSNCQWYYNCELDSLGNWNQTPFKCLRMGTVYSASYKRCVPEEFLSSLDPCVSQGEPNVVHNHHHHTVVTAAQSVVAPAPAPTNPRRYVCTLFGLVVTYLFPGLLDTFCASIST